MRGRLSAERERERERERGDAISRSSIVYDDRAILASLRLCARACGQARGPSVKQYAGWHRANPGTPSPARIAQRFGRWRVAVEAAGLECAAGTQPGHTRLYTEADCAAAVRECAIALGKVPTFDEYAEHARREGGEAGIRRPGSPPSPSTLRNVLGPRWLGVLEASLPERVWL